VGLNSLIERFRKLGSPANIERAALTVFSEMNTRIFEDGKASNGGPIGSYSTDPAYISLSASPRKITPRGKTGKTKFSDGRPHTSAYFKDGYKGFRRAVGRDADNVNLKLFGDLQRAWVAGPKPGGYLFGYASAGEERKADGNESRFKKEIFSTTKAERELFLKLIVDPITAI
jgi:hypothetical protein